MLGCGGCSTVLILRLLGGVLKAWLMVELMLHFDPLILAVGAGMLLIGVKLGVASFSGLQTQACGLVTAYQDQVKS